MEDEKLMREIHEQEKRLHEKVKKTIEKIHENVIVSTSEMEYGKRVEVGIREYGALDLLSYKIVKIVIEYSEKKIRTQKERDIIFSRFASLFKDLAQKYHIFVDGNKRTSYLTIKIFLLTLGYHLKVAYYKEALPFILDVASGKKTNKEITQWLSEHASKIENNNLEKYVEKCMTEIEEKQS